MKTKTTITLSVDGDLKVKAMRIVQKGNLSLSAKFNDFLREFVSKYDSNLKLIPLE
jgi:antitoxin component of RelBE/YafQ-DinJ toxin-antitoxin module